MGRRKICGHCHEVGHNRRTCTNPPASGVTRGPGSRCSICKELGHTRANCLQNPEIARALRLYRRGTSVGRIRQLTGLTRRRIYNAARKAGLPVASNKPGPSWESRHPGIADRLGKEADADIAKDYGISKERVRQYRKKKGVPRYYAKIQALPEAGMSRLGTVPDGVLAEEYNIGIHRIRQLRKDLNIDPYQVPGVEETRPELIAKLGEYSDHELGREFGLAPSRVREIRRVRGIASKFPKRTPINEKYPGILGLLGKEPDRVIAAQYGISASRAQQIRTNAGIKPCGGRRSK